MSIIFHEGLPGAGKSYEAVMAICQQLLEGRSVYAYIEGLNHKKFAEVTGIPLKIIQTLLIQVDREQVKNIYDVVKNDSFVIIDEIQNFWPSTRDRLAQEITLFVTEHRHRGLDILIMGQDYRDCHNLWKRRIDKRLVFVKLDALGLNNKYRYTVYQQVNQRWNKVSGATESYDSKYFGAYLSHTIDTGNKSDHKDKRFTVWNSPFFKFGLPAFVVVLTFAISSLVSFFSNDNPVQNTEQKPVETKSQVVNKKPVEPIKPVEIQKQPLPVETVSQELPPEKALPSSYIGELSEKYRPRLSGFITNGDRMSGVVEFLDTSFHVKERLSFESIRELGWGINETTYGMVITKGTEHHIITAWPVDPFGSVSYRTRNNPAMTTDSR